MGISEICAALKRELLDNGYRYGFCRDGVCHVPDPALERDAAFAERLATLYRVQSPAETARHRIGTCIDAVVLMRSMLDDLGVPCRLWLRRRPGGGPHMLLTFEAEGKTVYLELTPQSDKPWYGREIVYDSVEALLDAFAREGYTLTDVTGQVAVGMPPRFDGQAADPAAAARHRR